MSEELYQYHLKELLQRNPKEPLLAVLSRGYSAANITFMKIAVARIPEEDVIFGNQEEEVPELSKEAKLNQLFDSKRKLFGLLYKQSNEFHRCKSDNERKVNSDKVLAIWSQIIALKTRIEIYQSTGVDTQDNQEEPEDIMPSNPVTAGKKLNSLRANKSQTSKKIQDLFLAGVVKDDDRILKLEAKIKRLNIQIQAVEKILKEWEGIK